MVSINLARYFGCCEISLSPITLKATLQKGIIFIQILNEAIVLVYIVELVLTLYKTKQRILAFVEICFSRSK